MLLKKSSIILLISLISLLNSSTLYSQELSGIELYPAQESISLSKGEVFESQFNIRNNESISPKLTFSEAFLEDGNLIPQESKWFSLKKDTDLLPSSDYSSIQYSVSVPEEIESGYYERVLLIDIVFPDSNISYSLPFTLQINFFSNQSDEQILNTNLLLNKIKSQDKLIFGNSVSYSFVVTNLDKRFPIKPSIYTNIISPSGKIYFNENLNESFVLIDSDKDFLVDAELLNNSIFPEIGEYKIQVLAQDVNTLESKIETRTFIYVDWRYVVFLISLIVLVLLTIKRKRKKSR